MEATHTNGRDYRTAVTDPTVRKVLDALADPRWDFRIPRGIADEMGIPEEEVRAILERYPEYVQAFDFPNRTGEPVYTLRHPGWRRRLRQYRKIFSVYASMEVP